MAKKAYIGINGVARAVKKGYIGVNPYGLPTEYTQLEYIEADGTQYFDTGISLSGATVSLKMDFQFTQNISNTFAVRVYKGGDPFVAGVYQDAFYLGGITASQTSDLLAKTTFTGTTIAVVGMNIVFFAQNIDGVGILPGAHGRLFMSDITVDGAVHTFIPCKDKNGAVGLYDTLTGQFGTGSGGFIAGTVCDPGIARKIKKVYIGVNGIARLCYEEGSAIGTMTISYTGNMIDAGIVSMTDGEYRLLTLTSSGTLTVDREVSAEFWMCGGGTGGQTFDPGSDIYGRGGCGAYAKNGSLTLSGSAVATVASRAGASSFGGLSTGTTSAGVYLATGGSGGGGTVYADPGNGDGISKYPFGDTSYFKPHCGGGGGGGYDNIHHGSYYYAAHGGNGGTNGGNGESYKNGGNRVAGTGGAGGNYGGGDGGDAGDNGNKASFYGSGGGGGGYRYDDDEGESYIGSGGVGYQGVIYIRIPVNQ